MTELEGGALREAVRPDLAYAEGEDGGGPAEREGSPVRLDTADGDVIETSFGADLVSIRMQLEEQARTAERAIRASLELRNELNAARAEAATLKEAVDTLRKSDSPPADNPEASPKPPVDPFTEIARVRTEALRARRALEKERNEHQAELIQAKAEYNSAQEELQRLIQVRRAPAGSAAAKSNARRPTAKPGRPPRKIGKKILVASVIVAISASVVIGWQSLMGQSLVGQSWPAQSLAALGWPGPANKGRAQVSPPPTPAAPPERPVRPQPPPPPLRSPTALDIQAVMTPAGRSQFQGAVGRLSRSLGGHFGRSPQEILREVHERYKSADPNICAFDWRNGQPALLYSGGTLSISDTLQRCADAVERASDTRR